MKHKTATREDIARTVGVSTASVSRALNNSGYVKKDVKQRIIEVAGKLGYNPNPIALSLQRRKTKQLLLYQNDLTAPFNIQFFKGAAQAASELGYSVCLDVLCDFSKTKERMVDGVMFSVDILAEQYLQECGKHYRLPVVSATNDPSFPFSVPLHMVMIDNQSIINLAIDYLQSQGHQEIGLVVPSSAYGDIRFEFWKQRMRKEIKAGNVKNQLETLVIRPDAGNRYVEKHPDFAEHPILLQAIEENFEDYLNINIGKMAADEYSNSKNPATAFICFNDDLAYGFIGRLDSLGIRVPEDISVMGIDGIYLRDWFPQKLTTVSTQPEQIGALCTKVMVDVLQGEHPRYVSTISPAVLTGETVKNRKEIFHEMQNA